MDRKKFDIGQELAHILIANPVSARWKTGAGEGIRTLDPDLGKVVLYP